MVLSGKNVILVQSVGEATGTVMGKWRRNKQGKIIEGEGMERRETRKGGRK